MREGTGAVFRCRYCKKRCRHSEKRSFPKLWRGFSADCAGASAEAEHSGAGGLFVRQAHAGLQPRTTERFGSQKISRHRRQKRY